MTTDTRTTNQNYPLPYPSNLLAADVVRLRDALIAIDADIAGAVTTADMNTAIQTAVDGLIDGAGASLDTLNELAAALGDDSNFASTVTTALAARLELAGGTMTGALELSGDPTSALQAATKQYTDGVWTSLNSAATLAAMSRYLIDCSAGSFTVTLPATPAAGDFVVIADAKACFATYPLTIAANGSNIAGAALDLVANVSQAVVTLIYSGDATTGWLVK